MHTHTHTHTHVLWNVFVLMSPQPNKACTPKHYKSNTTQSGNPTSLLTLYAPFSLPAVTSRNEYLTHRVCVCVSLCMYMWEHSEVEGGGHIYTDCYDWDRLNNSAGAPSKCGAVLSGPARFSALALNQSAWFRYSRDARVRAAQSAAPRGQGSSWQACTAMANRA